MNVRPISITKSLITIKDKELTAEDLIAYAARVSAPNNQENLETAPKLLKYLITNKHWSPFEMASFTVEITTSRAIAAQILRHKSFFFQEFSLRYSQATDFEYYEARRQDVKNRQNSLDDLPQETKDWFLEAQTKINTEAYIQYAEALKRNVAKESARFLLPLSTQTKIYMCGSVRSWIHYLELRSAAQTQLEHREIAIAIKNEIFKPNFPATSEALGW